MIEINTVEKLGKMIREERKHQGLTQMELAASCGVGMRFLRELEYGKESCHMGKALHVIKMLGLKLCVNIEGSQE